MLPFENRRTIPRPGFTLVELLVVIAIIGVLIGLMATAIQKTRASASRMQCQNNLKQIGLALNGYHEGYKKFPPGYVSGVDSKGADTGPGWGWASFVLPRLEQQAISDQIKFDQPVEAAVHAAVRTTPIATFRCPADRNALVLWTAKKYDANGTPIANVCDLAQANYTGVFGVSEPGVDGEGMFYRNSAVRMAEVVDGTSNTLLVGERASTWATATWVGVVAGAELFPEDSSNFVLGHTGEMKNAGAAAEGNNFSSDHSNGVNFVFVDGHVQFLTSSISAAVLQALSTRAGHEPVTGVDP